jgi:hypothetical protein
MPSYLIICDRGIVDEVSDFGTPNYERHPPAEARHSGRIYKAAIAQHD